MVSIRETPEFRIPTHEEHERISALFLGPKAENAALLKECFDLIVEGQQISRRNYFAEDPDFITSSTIESQAYNKMAEKLKSSLTALLDGLGRFSIPFFSPRYSAHMSVDQSLPAILGYLSTMFYNPNNVAFEASPFTTLIELEVGKELCEMMGYNIDKTVADRPLAWGHITCDGTVANLESIWAARNLKFYPLSLRDAMAPGAPLEFIATSFMIETCQGASKLLQECDAWELLNLKVQTIIEIPERLYKEYHISSQFLENVMKNYIIQQIGKDAVMKKWGIDLEPVILIPSTKHYSWPKGAAIAGIGSANAINVGVDKYARMDLALLSEKLKGFLKEKRAVYEVVAVIGTTEEGAVDRLAEIKEIRDEFRKLGLSFVLHADAAWGGYFASMLPRKNHKRGHGERSGPEVPEDFVPQVGLRLDTAFQLEHLKEADSITIDPHKAGYVPYPAGGLCYRDGRMRYLLTWTAPYISQAVDGESISVYGVEGSKPGAAACSVYLAHHVIGLGPEEHGSLLGEVSFTCRRFAGHWAAMSDLESSFIVVPFNISPAELLPNATTESIQAEKEFIRERILGVENAELVKDREAMGLLNNLGSDLNINAFACNFRYPDGTINRDIEEANWLNQRMFERLSVTSSKKNPLDIPFYITSTTFSQSGYGECATAFKKRLGLEGAQDLFVLRNVVMSPFASTRDFMAGLADIFKQVLQEEVNNVLRRNEIRPDLHTFLVQGSDPAYLVHLPSFHQAAGRSQFIFRADVREDSARGGHHRPLDPTAQVFLTNTEPLLLNDIVDGSSFKATLKYMSGDEESTTSVNVVNVMVIKRRSLDTEDFSSEYPVKMPFYLYGDSHQAHIDHMLLLAPNIQLSAAGVEALEFDPPISKLDISKGVVAIAENIHEASMQPFPGMKTLGADSTFFFVSGGKLQVTIYKDPFPTSTSDPVSLGSVTEVLGKGVLGLGGNVYVDSDRLNGNGVGIAGDEKRETDAGPPLLLHRSGRMKHNTKKEWVKNAGKFHSQIGTPP